MDLRQPQTEKPVEVSGQDILEQHDADALEVLAKSLEHRSLVTIGFGLGQCDAPRRSITLRDLFDQVG
jgi:hypothetical protein